jgi:hypothetical protein
MVSARSVFCVISATLTQAGMWSRELTFLPRCSKISFKVLNTPSEVKFNARPPRPIVMKSADASSSCASVEAIVFLGARTGAATVFAPSYADLYASGS